MEHYKIKKELKKYIKDCLSKGYSLTSIHKALIKYGYEAYAGSLIRTYKIKKSISVAIPLSIIILLIFGLFYSQSNIIGLLILGKQFDYSDRINLNFEVNSEYIWIPEHQGTLKSLRLSGSYKPEGNVKVYLEDEGIRYLIFDSSKLNKNDLSGITGLVVSDKNNEAAKDKPIKPEKPEPNTPPVWKSDVNEFIIDGKTTFDLNEYFFDKDNDAISYISTTPDKISVEINNNLIILTPTEQNFNTAILITASDGIKSTTKEVTLIVPERKIEVNLEYKKDTVYDADNDGIEDTTGIIDLTVENTNFNWDVDEDNLCTRWNILNEDEVTTVCYGGQNCCAFVDLASSKQAWNEPLFLSYGLYGSSLNNKVSAQVIHVDYDLSLEEPYSEIYYSSWEELQAKFYQQFISFENICIGTCSLSLRKDSYKLIIEIENTALKIDEIEYAIGGRIINELPILTKNIENINIIENKNYTLDLNEYFFDADNDKLTYDYFETDNITIKFEDNFAYIIPDKGFVGNRFTFIYANDSFVETNSNVFRINITKEAKEQTIESKVVINKPVKWLKKVKFDKITNNATINITSFAANITVRKIKDNIIEEILKENIKIKYRGKIKGLIEYEIEKSLEKIKDINELTEVIIEDSIEEVEIEYFTGGPSSEEIKISSNRKQITISSDIHYKDILAFTNLPIEANSEAIKLFWLINGTKIEVNIDKFDTNGNNLIDYIEWIVPSLSNQTYEVEITILNVQSFPTLFGNWTVRFNTSGTGNLTITATNGTTYSEIYEDNSTTTDDLSILELKCDNTILFNYYDNINNDNVYLINENKQKLRLNETINKSLEIKSLFVENYSCSGIGYWTVKVITPGIHTQQFNFSEQITYAFNTVASDVCDEGDADTLCVVNTIHGKTAVLYETRH